ncbi:hypothetical protein DM02DRAFT_75130 [Periconia macrospinosa]|uniref:Uncharacterized protein n=1 Tax=Periconia macrospinosa TaxID=97972 RepID=A0A2V1DKJ4_9PLEO|nr:hypothetical protein DM02DRAFT_75130 [Periconia macrospinosa]
MTVPQLFKWSPRPGHNPDASPASQSSSRFGPFSALHNNVRSMVNGSSVYSQSPNPNPSNENTPKIPFLGRFRREQSPAPITIPNSTDPPRDSSDSRSPLRPQHTAGSYMRTIAPLGDPRAPQTAYAGQNGDRHPADVQLDYHGSGGLDPEIVQLQNEINGRRRRRRRHRRRHHAQSDGHWVRRRNSHDHGRGRGTRLRRGTAARGKLMACIISGSFLVLVLTVYLALALGRKDLDQEIHVLFIMIVLATTIFFCHSLIRLCMLIMHPPSDEPPYIPSMTGPEGFVPAQPIRVHLARDEDLDEERGLSSPSNTTSGDLTEKPVALPPPAYGLWRSSVRVDPNLLHWQRVQSAQSNPPVPSSRSGSAISTRSRDGGNAEPAPAAGSVEDDDQGPRPPSYMSEDGVSYIVEAAPRSIAPSHSGVSDIHPAWRPGYAVSEVPMEEWPRGVPTRV